jgi:hypothetical protein
MPWLWHKSVECACYFNTDLVHTVRQVTLLLRPTVAGGAMRRRDFTRILSLVWAVFLLTVAPGCMTTESHTAYKPYILDGGMWCGTFTTGFVEARAAAIAALADMQMPVVREERTFHGSYIDTQTPDGFHVRIHFRSPTRHEAVNGPVTHVAVRVGGFGTHEKVCASILDGIGHHLGSVPSVVATPSAPAASPAPAVLPASGPATSPDPSLPPQPVPVGK